MFCGSVCCVVSTFRHSLSPRGSNRSSVSAYAQRSLYAVATSRTFLHLESGSSSSGDSSGSVHFLCSLLIFACIFRSLDFVAIVESQEPTSFDLASPVGAQRPPFCHKLSSIAHQPKPLKKLTTSSISRDTAVYPLTTWPPPAALWAGPPASRTSHAGHKSPDRLRATGGVVR